MITAINWMTDEKEIRVKLLELSIRRDSQPRSSFFSLNLLCLPKFICGFIFHLSAFSALFSETRKIDSTAHGNERQARNTIFPRSNKSFFCLVFRFFMCGIFRSALCQTCLLLRGWNACTHIVSVCLCLCYRSPRRN